MVEPENLGTNAGETWRPKGTKKVGFVDVDVDNLKIGSRLAFYTQFGRLVLQFRGACAMAFPNRSPEVIIALLVAPTARKDMVQSVASVSIHAGMQLKGHDSTCTLTVRKARHKSQIVSLEKFCWSFESPRMGPGQAWLGSSVLRAFHSTDHRGRVDVLAKSSILPHFRTPGPSC